MSYSVFARSRNSFISRGIEAAARKKKSDFELISGVQSLKPKSTIFNFFNSALHSLSSVPMRLPAK